LPATRLNLPALYAPLPIFASRHRTLGELLTALARHFALPFGPAQFMGGSNPRCDAEDNMGIPQ